MKGVCPCNETLLQSLKLQSSGTPIVYLFLFSVSLMAVHFIQVVVHFKESDSSHRSTCCSSPQILGLSFREAPSY